MIVFVNVSDVFALLAIAFINVVVTVDESPITAAISCSVLRTAGAVPIRSEKLISIDDLVYASIPVTVILFASDDKLIPTPGTMLFYYCT